MACFSFLCFTTVISTESSSNFTGLASRNEIVLHFLFVQTDKLCISQTAFRAVDQYMPLFLYDKSRERRLVILSNIFSLIRSTWILTLRGMWKKVEADRRTFHYRFQLLCSRFHRAKNPFPFAVSFFMHGIKSIYIV